MIQSINKEPYILDETGDFAVVYKPPRMHCENKYMNFNREPQNPTTQDRSDEPTRKYEEDDTLFSFYKQKENDYLRLMHRLDYETHGLVLFAKNEKSFNYLKDLQDRGEFIKEYSAICSVQNNFSQTSVSSFQTPDFSQLSDHHSLLTVPFIIESYFRPYGPGRKTIRPITDEKKNHKETAKDKGGFYKTEVINIENNIFTVRIKRGFRHQIRCHLCWKGFPIINDPLYPQITETHDFLALRSQALFFCDPLTEKKIDYRIEPLYEI